ncbi:T9SS type A sorting domain-containing protein [Polluticoccus soli]|uniref:T9SS type A sorting domain-containing protein n=1 Tax=Polluticoccus soli TaxID=3034150 RepID=UPI0023E2BCD5|nr:T9SS type A sorting domain-containing protein [Flavipsychrobacter sp. JY13-12]
MKNYTLFLLVMLLSVAAGAQTYYPVTHNSGPQTIGGRTVTVTGINVSSVFPAFNCVGPYLIGSGGINGYKFEFSTPVYKVRTNFAIMHTGENVRFFINGSQYMLTPTDVSALPVSCSGMGGTAIALSGDLSFNTAAGAHQGAQVNISSLTAIDSIRIMHTTGAGGGCLMDFAFADDTTITITQPYIDTLKCPSDSVHVAFTVNQTMQAGNVFTLQLSNAFGSFATPVTIGTLTATTSGIIHGKLPNVTPGTGYRVRIVSTNPARASQDNGINIKVVNTLGSVLATSNSPICEDGTLNLSASGSLPNTTYGWTGPNSYTSAIQNPTIASAQPTQSGDYIVTASLNGCSVKDTVTVLVKPKPAVPTANNNGPVCEGASINLTSNSTTPGALYNWTGPNSFTASQQNPTIATTVLAHTGTYSVTASLNGCTSAAGTTNVTIKPYPAVPTAGNNTPICAGANLNLTANSSTSGVTYSWTGPNGFTSATQNPTINAAGPNDAGTYQVTATLNGCTSAAGSTVPVINIVSSIGGWASPSDTVCAGSTVTFVVVPTNPGPTPTYQWYKNGAAISGANSTLYVTSAVADGDSFYCQMIAPNVCANTLNLYSNGIKMHVLPITTTPSIDISSNPSAPLPGQNILFIANVSNGGYKPTFQWQRNGQNVTGAIHANWSTSGLHPNDKINCIVESSDPCATPKAAYSDTMVVNFPTGINDMNKGELSLYPNPNNGSFVVYLPSAGGHVRIDVVNAVGQKVYTVPMAAGTKMEVTLPASVANGAYMLKLTTNNGVQTIPFTVNR